MAEIDKTSLGIFVEDVGKIKKVSAVIGFKQIVGCLDYGIAAGMIVQFALPKANFVGCKTKPGFLTSITARSPYLRGIR